MRNGSLILAFIFVAACSKKPAEPATTTPEPAAEPSAEPAPPDGGEARPQLTAAACEAQGGKVIGDIGDGAVHRPEYRCESGEPPVGSIVADPGGPVAIEGAVCCK